MRVIFADAHFFVALLNERDQSHLKALAANQKLAAIPLMTTEEVLTEVLAFFAERGRHLRTIVSAYIDDLLSDPEVIVLAQSHDSFLEGFAFYKARPDKGYSLTDSISMEAMRRHGIAEVLTHDGHFAQEGFRLLL